VAADVRRLPVRRAHELNGLGPTDTMPLTHRVKLIMGVQAGAAMITVGLLVARAVGNLT
jgi:hypothetical protein